VSEPRSIGGFIFGTYPVKDIYDHFGYGMVFMDDDLQAIVKLGGFVSYLGHWQLVNVFI
jgi:hypothetical protein